jgi:hypothetical protein
MSSVRLGVLASALVLLSSRASFADDDVQKARATGLFAEAQALSQAGKHAEACAKFEESVRLHSGVGNQYHLADCWEKIGRTASAYTTFQRVVEKTRELEQPEREKAARERADALAPKLTRLRIEVKAPPKKLSLTRNGETVSKESIGVPVPIDPGTHELRASAPGKATWSEELEVPAEPGTIVVTVPELADEKTPVAAVAAAPVAATKPPPREPPPPAVEEQSGGGFRSVATIGLLGIGVAGAIVGSVTGFQYAMNNRDAEAICPQGVGCTDDEIARHEELVDDARTQRTIMYAGFGAAAVGLGGALVLHLTAPSKKERPNTAWLGARVFVSREGAITGALQGGF